VTTKTTLAIHGGKPAVSKQAPELFDWPILTKEDENAVLEVLRARSMSNTDVTEKFEKEFAEWEGTEFCLACNNGTSAIHCALYGAGVRRGDEVITPTYTFWATHTQLLSLGATPVFCDIDPFTLCLDPKDVAKRITSKTKAIIVVHLFGYPADMDAIIDMVDGTGIKVVEDFSHAHGSTFRDRKVGSIGHVGAASIMSSKPFATGEGGVLTTNDRNIYEQAVCFGHYERIASCVQDPNRLKYAGLPWGGHKFRMHQMTSAIARAQLKKFDARRAEGVSASERFYNKLRDIPGVKPHWPFDDERCAVGSSYCERIILGDEIISKVPAKRICEAISAEGSPTSAGTYYCHHLHPLWNELDVYGDGKPTSIAFASRDTRLGPGSLPIAENINDRLISAPRFSVNMPKIVDQHAEAFRKVLSNLDQI